MNLNEDMENSKQFLINSYLEESCKRNCIPMKLFLSNIEREMIGKALKIARGNQRVASLILGMKPTTLHEKIRKFNIQGKKRIDTRHELREAFSKIDFSSI